MLIHIWLVRHGHVEGIKPARFRGQYDVPLSAQGEREALATAGALAKVGAIDAVYTSPMGRCVVTGQAIAERVGQLAQPLQDLNDIHYGAWQWRTHAEVEAAYPEGFRAWRESPQLVRFPEGDSLQDLVARTADAVRFVSSRHEGKQVVLVGHDSVNRAILLQALDQPLSAYWRITQDACAINLITLDGAQTRVLRVNDTHHLDHLSSTPSHD